MRWREKLEVWWKEETGELRTWREKCRDRKERWGAVEDERENLKQRSEIKQKERLVKINVENKAHKGDGTQKTG